MSGENADALMKSLRQHFISASCHLIDEQTARTLLLFDAARWQETTVNIEDSLVDRHGVFNELAEHAWYFAERLIKFAHMVSE